MTAVYSNRVFGSYAVQIMRAVDAAVLEVQAYCRGQGGDAVAFDPSAGDDPFRRLASGLLSSLALGSGEDCFPEQELFLTCMRSLNSAEDERRMRALVLQQCQHLAERCEHRPHAGLTEYAPPPIASHLWQYVSSERYMPGMRFTVLPCTTHATYGRHTPAFAAAGAAGKLLDSEVVGNVVSMFGAGSDGVLAATYSTLVQLALHPEALAVLSQALHDQRFSAFAVSLHPAAVRSYWAASKAEAFIEAVQDSVVLGNTLREAMRCDAEVTLIRRCTTRDCELLDETGATLRLPRGTRIVIDNVAVHRDPLVWGPDASRYNPERWQSKDESQRRTIFLAFGGGYVLFAATFQLRPRVW
jgi:hypothetical protein